MMKTAELIGEKLNYWVARARGWELDPYGASWRQWATGIGGGNGGFYIDMGECQKWSPSTDWAQGGPLIEKHSIVITDAISGAPWHACTDHSVYVDNDWIAGDTYLIAGMRAFVATVYGDKLPEDFW